jgi:hypothetical protein
MKRNLWPLGIILTFVIFISGTAFLIVLAATHSTDLVNENYYEQELRFQTHLDGLQRANRLAQPATVIYAAASKHIALTLPPSHANRSIVGNIELYRPSAAGLDRQIEFKPDTSGVQLFDATDMQSGLWKVRVTWTVDGQEFCIDQKINVKKL